MINSLRVHSCHHILLLLQLLLLQLFLVAKTSIHSLLIVTVFAIPSTIVLLDSILLLVHPCVLMLLL